MNKRGNNGSWERRQTELWDRIFQVTQDVVELADSLDDTSGGVILKGEMVRSAMEVGKHLVRATASEDMQDFQHHAYEARMKAIETDYWLRLAYIVQQGDDVQRDLSSIVTQYSSVIDLLQKMSRHVRDEGDVTKYTKGPKVNL